MRVIAILIVAIFVRPPLMSAQRSDAEAVRVTRAMAARLRESAPLSGLSVAISRKGRVIYAEGFGYADIESKQRVKRATRFRTASVGKVITATALGRLVQEGRLNLDVPVQEYVPSFPMKTWPITARELAGHLSGLPHYTDDDKVERRFYPSVLDALGVFAHQQQRSEPNSAYLYSTHGYTLLSAVIEAAARRPFLEYLQQAVFEPLGMRSTGPDMRARPAADLATFYQWTEGRLSRIERPEDPSYKWAGGGLTSTPSDLLRLAEGYFNGYLQPPVVSAMWTSQRLTSGHESGVGLGWRISRDVAGRRVIEHAGSMEGSRTVLCIFPQERVAIALMANREWSSTIEETAHMLALPFLAPASSHSLLRGRSEGTLEEVAVSGQKTSHPAALTIDGNRGNLRFTVRGNDEKTYSLFQLTASGVYGLVRPDGIYYSTLSCANGLLALRVLGYGSPQLQSLAGNPPFMIFRGRLP